MGHRFVTKWNMSIWQSQSRLRKLKSKRPYSIQNSMGILLLFPGERRKKSINPDCLWNHMEKKSLKLHNRSLIDFCLIHLSSCTFLSHAFFSLIDCSLENYSFTVLRSIRKWTTWGGVNSSPACYGDRYVCNLETILQLTFHRGLYSK